jgi:hypothetical protein
MLKIQNLTSEPIQRHTVLFRRSEVILTIRYYPKPQLWVFDAEYNNKSVYGLKLSVGVLHMVSQNQPFDFFVVDNSGLGLDPLRIDDFSSERCSLYMLEPDDMILIRAGAEVPLADS